MTAASPPRSRGLVIALACALAVCLVMIVVIVGGLVILVQRGQEPEDALETVELEGFTTVVPAEWEDEDADLEGAEILLRRGSADGEQMITIGRLGTTGSTGEELCDTLQQSAEDQGLTTEYSRSLDPIQVDGREAQVRSWAAEDAEDAWSRGDLLCVDGGADSGALFLLAENSHEGETAQRLPELEQMLEQWRWTD
jgi:hypothetical protein